MKCRIPLLSIAVLMGLSIISLALAADKEHIYYGYVPPSSDISQYWQVVELINGTYYNYSAPPGTALLDIVGTEDGTEVKVIDLATGDVIAKARLSKFGKFTCFIPYGTFFKVVSNKRVLVHMCGGAGYLGYSGGAYCIYPSVSGGFRGKHFIIIPEKVSDQVTSYYRMGFNILIMGLTKANFELVDSINKWSFRGSVDQMKSGKYHAWARRAEGIEDVGPGYSMVFELKTSDDIQLAAVSTGGFTAVPAVTGGFVGRLFFAPAYISWEAQGVSAAVLIVPIEPCKVEIYDSSLNLIASKEFSKEDVAKDQFWFYSLGDVRKDLVIKSTGDITVLVGTTNGKVAPEFLGDDVTFMGARPGQLLKFYAPTLAVVFVTEDSTVTIDGVSRRMSADSYVILDRGVHSVKADCVLIVEILGASTGWSSWGTYLVSPLDIMASFEVPSGFAERKGGISPLIIALIIVVGGAIAFIYMRKRGLIGKR